MKQLFHACFLLFFCSSVFADTLPTYPPGPTADPAGHVLLRGGTPGTIAAGCGSTATVAGNDSQGKMTMAGSGQSATACSWVFGTAFTTAPTCLCTDETTFAKNACSMTTTTSGATFTFAAAPAANDVVSFVCFSR